MKDLSLPAILAVLAVVAAALAATAAATPGAGAVTFKIKGVGMGVFANATIASKPGKGNGTDSGLCVTLEGGSRDNSPALISWLNSNSAGAALASKPDASLTVPTSQNGLRKGVYHLSHITVDDYTKKADQDMSHPRLEAVKVKCETLEDPLSSGQAG